MKKLVVTAAALMLGTSALAWAPAEEAHAGMEAYAAWTGQKDSSLGKGMTMKAESATLASSSNWTKTEPLGGKTAAKWSDAGMQASSSVKGEMDEGSLIADADFKSKEDVGGIQMAAVTETYPEKANMGVGGPYETAAVNYPPCDPGPGDDRCIQLYEPGVRQALAAWKGAESNMGMGGPYEPAAADTKPQSSTAQSGDAHAGHDMSATKPQAPTTGQSDDGQSVPASKPTGTTAPTSGTNPGAIGGPIESRTGYPACSATITDSCIQLHERGVTGQGN